MWELSLTLFQDCKLNPYLQVVVMCQVRLDKADCIRVAANAMSPVTAVTFTPTVLQTKKCHKTNIVLVHSSVVLWDVVKKELPMVCPEIPECSLMLFWIYNDNDIDIFFFQLALLIWGEKMTQSQYQENINQTLLNPGTSTYSPQITVANNSVHFSALQRREMC